MTEVVPLKPADPLAKLEAWYGSLEEATSLEEVKQLRDMAEAARTYARAAKLGIAAQNTAAAFKVRAERKAGELLVAQGFGERGGDRRSRDRVSLESLDIAAHQSKRWQKLAAIPEARFEDAVEDAVYTERELTTASLLQLARVLIGSAVGADSELPPLPEGTFRTIVADPPWRYGNGSTRNAARKHYPTMTVEEVCALDIESRAHDESHLYLWTTNNFLREAFDVVDAWGFEYKTCLTWVKPQMGMGNYFRGGTEHVLFGVRGGMRTQSRSLVNWFEASRGRHSAKPQHFYELVEKASPGPFLEMFARARRLGWTGWGNEA